jgi:hypothetical protein
VVVKVSLRLGSGKKAFKILSGKIRSDRFFSQYDEKSFFWIILNS